MKVLGVVIGFYMFINDLPLCILSADVDCDMFADDSSLNAAEKSIAAINTSTDQYRRQISKKYLIGVLPT